MQIRDLDPEAPEEREFCAQRLVEEFRGIAPDAWPTIDKARQTVDECLRNGPVRVAHVNGTIVGWIGGHHVFSRVWERAGEPGALIEQRLDRGEISDRTDLEVRRRVTRVDVDRDHREVLNEN
jgi:hypothetical protein